MAAGKQTLSVCEGNKEFSDLNTFETDVVSKQILE